MSPPLEFIQRFLLCSLGLGGRSQSTNQQRMQQPGPADHIDHAIQVEHSLDTGAVVVGVDGGTHAVSDSRSLNVRVCGRSMRDQWHARPLEVDRGTFTGAVVGFSVFYSLPISGRPLMPPVPAILGNLVGCEDRYEYKHEAASQAEEL